ncbi:hypothetical protein Pint_13226 [Pistacia integerrima]|uniref:Uncharacterized protein n=2 Tax=Pistacia integerrima TaxID=434235 RepID=A0ACC0Y8H8_9ROSI|nr:hypothetical protein Pint_13223 [Pistacia integerrima]KAJ0030702.1 hypothetical protein Pint_13226 [Pistacia integerrima]
MSVEHDYIGLSAESEVPNSMENSGLNLKATELRLGLPGSESPERESSENNTVVVSLKSFVGSGAKRGFSDAIDAKWVFSGSDPALYSPRTAASNGSKLLAAPNSPLATPVVKEAAAQSPKPVVLQDKKRHGIASSSKAQVVGWPPIRSFRKNTMSSHSPKNEEDSEAKLGLGCLYVKVSMDGAPYLRKVDLKIYGSYMELSSALEKMFSCFTIGQCGSHNIPSRDGLSESRLMDLLHGSEYVLTYEDKDGDWMLVGDVPWEMFTNSCKRLRIMKSSEAIGLGGKMTDTYVSASAACSSKGNGEVQKP